ncbi:hypothetical protein [Anaerotignum sp. MB30-C6]|uniref:hypothetical protein n=1 Tax=Anaerotignum sp. MB30-C6 TaxID=3070814 RepID=UPI0027DBB47F|nr:hypothetical protein [Anaerotignum sp. MB30-C6]WMI81582.1 hypothetical protein RBQ60_02265 [Anaerotignum sp. MB30-C6]
MKGIPVRLECYYCIRAVNHGGQCSGKTNYPAQGCLAFKADPRGCIRSTTTTVQITIYHEFPLLGVWNDDFEMGSKETEIKITKIHGIKWDRRKGYLCVICSIDYFINDFADDYQESKDKVKPVLKLVKGGAE